MRIASKYFVGLFLSVLAICQTHYLRLKYMGTMTIDNLVTLGSNSETNELKALFFNQSDRLKESDRSLYSVFKEADAIYTSDLRFNLGMETADWLSDPAQLLTAIQNSKNLDDITDDELVLFYEHFMKGPLPIIMFRNYSKYHISMRNLDIFSFILVQYIVFRFIFLL
ncbi:hypothetical protein BD560DRAFT_422018 [Blakeslea trispora]|nr:hypothetical protein BD560DRAFT_422018 [Blakeslea trispora]